MAYELKCKGITVYRDGCRQEQPMALKNLDKRKESQTVDDRQKTSFGDDYVVIEPQDIPEIVSGLRIRQMTPFGNMHVKITVDPKSGRDLEVFAQLGKGGDIANSDLEAICRLISLWLRAGGSLQHVVRQLKDIGSTLQVPTRDGKIMSLGDGLARALMKYTKARQRFGLHDLLIGDYRLSDLDGPGSGGSGNGNGNGNGNGKGHGVVATKVRHASTPHGDMKAGASAVAGSTGASRIARLAAFKVKCPSCGEGLTFTEGCNVCYGCGWAQC